MEKRKEIVDIGKPFRAKYDKVSDLRHAKRIKKEYSLDPVLNLFERVNGNAAQELIVYSGLAYSLINLS